MKKKKIQQAEPCTSITLKKITLKNSDAKLYGDKSTGSFYFQIYFKSTFTEKLYSCYAWSEHKKPSLNWNKSYATSMPYLKKDITIQCTKKQLAKKHLTTK